MPVNMDKLVSLDRAKEIKTTENGMIATVEASSTASKAYAVGDYFYYTGKLYKATAAIASGGTITVGTNCTLAKLGDDVGDLKSAITTINDVLHIVDNDISVTDTISNETKTVIPNVDLAIGDTVKVTLDSAVQKTVYYYVYLSDDTRYISKSIAIGNTTASTTLTDAIEDGYINVYTQATVGVTVEVIRAVQEPNEIDEINGKIGDLTLLNTTEKTNLVGAINEVMSDIPTQSEMEELAEGIATESIDDNYFDYSRNARYNFNDAIPYIGTYVNPDSGALRDNATEFTTDFLEIRPNETLYPFRVGSMEARKIDFYACYDKDKVYVPNSGGSNVYSVTQSGDVAYVRMSFAYQSAYYASRPEGIFIVPTDKPWFCQQINADPTVIEDYLPRKTIYVYATDTEQQVIEKFVDAYRRGNCDLQFERAHYMFGTVLPNVETLYKLNENEIPIGNGCRYYFNGSTLEAVIDLETLGADFYCNLLGTQRFPSSFEMYDGILISTDTRYVVHDEASGYLATYRRLYRNMEMHYITNLSTDGYRKCIGGGTGKNGVVDIDGCKFTVTGDGLVQDVSYHGCSPDVPGSEFSISVKNSWFSQTFAESTLGETQTAKVHLSGNSFGRAIIEYPRWEKTYFLNEIRT